MMLRFARPARSQPISLVLLVLSVALACGLFAAEAAAAGTAIKHPDAKDLQANGSPAEQSDPVVVHVDQAKLMPMPDHVGTIIVGNPLIADVALQPGNLLVVTGKGFGVTNFLALDRSGKVLSERQIQVKGPQDNVVVVYRGAERESYSCLPTCERRITLGDGPSYFDSVLNQSTTRNGQASSGSAGSASAAPR